MCPPALFIFFASATVKNTPQISPTPEIPQLSWSQLQARTRNLWIVVTSCCLLLKFTFDCFANWKNVSSAQHRSLPNLISLTKRCTLTVFVCPNYESSFQCLVAPCICVFLTLKQGVFWWPQLQRPRVLGSENWCLILELCQMLWSWCPIAHPWKYETIKSHQTPHPNFYFLRKGRWKEPLVASPVPDEDQFQFNLPLKLHTLRLQI